MFFFLSLYFYMLLTSVTDCLHNLIIKAFKVTAHYSDLKQLLHVTMFYGKGSYNASSKKKRVIDLALNFCAPYKSYLKKNTFTPKLRKYFVNTFWSEDVKRYI